MIGKRKKHIQFHVNAFGKILVAMQVINQILLKGGHIMLLLYCKKKKEGFRLSR